MAALGMEARRGYVSTKGKNAMKRFCLFLAVLLVAAGLHAGEPGIPTGVYFALPVVDSAGKTVKAKACIDAAHVLHVFYVEGDEVGMLDYSIARVPSPGPNPQPQPEPQPQPNPTPVPNKVAYLYLILDTDAVYPADKASAIEKIKNDKAWKDACDARGIRWQIFSAMEGKEHFPNATAEAVKKGLPAVVMFDKAGVPSVEAMPDPPNGMMALLKKYGGIQ
jgi:hypothetical protein